MNPLRRAERGLVRAADRRLDAEAPPGPLVRAASAAYLRTRHRTLHRAIRLGLWVPSAWRLAIALAVERGEAVIDLGANLGRVCQEAAWGVGPKGRVHAFEPSPTVAERLRRRIERLGLESRVTVHRAAVGAEPGTATLYEYARRDGGASSVRPQQHVGGAPTAEHPVRVVTVDDCLGEETGRRVALIKVDVEGAEIEALAGARRTISAAGRRRPVLVVEAAPVTQHGFGRGVDALLAAIHDLGYDTWACRPEGLVAVRQAGDLPPERRREDLLAIFSAHHAPLLERLERLSPRRGNER